MNILLQLAICLYLLPVSVLAQTTTTTATTVRDPLNYPLKQYGFILMIAMLGGGVSWWAKVRRGEIQATSISALIGELTTSAFSGLLVFWICEYFVIAPVLTACLAGLAGHAGGRGVAWLETMARRKVEATTGVSTTEPAPLGDK